MWPQKRRLKSEFSFFQSLLQLLQPFTLSNVKFSWPFSACLGHCNWPCLQSTTMNLQEWKRRKRVAGHGVLYCWACSEVSASMLFEEDYLPSLFLLIFHSNLSEYYFLSRICNVVCRELCAVLSANLHYFSVFKSDWVNIYLRCNKINFEIILKSRYGRKKSHWYYVILSQQEII